MRFATQAIHAAQPAETVTGALVAPIFQTTTYAQTAPGVHRGFSYTRTDNPTRRRLEEALAALEGVNYCAVYPSGLCATDVVFRGLLSPGDEVILPTDVYGGTHRLLYQVYARHGFRARAVDFARPEEWQAALTDRTRIVWVETPTNPRLFIYDLEQIAAAAHRRGALVAVDNTFATPLLQKPFELGADLVVYSVTKFIGGHSDVIQGAVLARDPIVFEPVKFLQNAAGGTASPYDCWLTLRGLKTLALRVRQQCANARAVAEALHGHPAVRRVYYPGFPDHPGHEIARRQMADFGGMVSVELNGAASAIQRFVGSRKYFALAEDLGGVHSLVAHPATMTHAAIPPEQRAALGLSDALVRLSPGCEDPEDLVADLLEGLDLLK